MSTKKAAKARKSAPRLRIENSCFSGLEIPLKKKTNTIGRSLDSDICLDDSLVSDEHAVITRTDRGFMLKDLNSRNGTTVGYKSIQDIRLKNGNIIRIGSFELKFLC